MPPFVLVENLMICKPDSSEKQGVKQIISHLNLKLREKSWGDEETR